MLHTPITADAATLARALLAGELPDTRADGIADWIAAAKLAMDDDLCDLEYLIERAASYDEFEAWAERSDRAGNYSFDDWYHGDFPGSNRAIAAAHYASLSAERRAELNQEWNEVVPPEVIKARNDAAWQRALALAAKHGGAL